MRAQVNAGTHSDAAQTSDLQLLRRLAIHATFAHDLVICRLARLAVKELFKLALRSLQLLLYAFQRLLCLCNGVAHFFCKKAGASFAGKKKES